MNRQDLQRFQDQLDAEIGILPNPALGAALPAPEGLENSAPGADLQVRAAPHGIDAPAMSDDALALEFVDRAADFRWSHGLGWMVDDGKIWSRDDNMQRYDVSRRVCREAASHCEDEGEAKRIASARTVSAALTMAQADPRIIIPSNVWDADPMALNTPKGIVDLRTGQLRKRGIEFVTQAARVAPAAGPCPNWHNFLTAVFLEDEGEAKRIASARTVSAALTMAQADPRIIIPSCIWDADPM
ncbi:MAG: hypothetical protein EOO27_47705, partial [Comamonadaceae bacterium]